MEIVEQTGPFDPISDVQLFAVFTDPTGHVTISCTSPPSRKREVRWTGRVPLGDGRWTEHGKDTGPCRGSSGRTQAGLERETLSHAPVCQALE